MLRSNRFPSRRRWFLGILVSALVFLSACQGPPCQECPPCPECPACPGDEPSTEVFFTGCVDFEDLAAGTDYVVSDWFASSGATIEVLPFQWGDGTWTDGGYTRVDGTTPIGTGQGMRVNNTNLSFNLGIQYVPLNNITLDFCSQGGNVNVIFNNNVLNVVDLPSQNGAVINGVTVTLTMIDSQCGTLTLDGPMDEFTFQPVDQAWQVVFAIGGQEFFIDNVCVK